MTYLRSMLMAKIFNYIDFVANDDNLTNSQRAHMGYNCPIKRLKCEIRL